MNNPLKLTILVGNQDMTLADIHHRIADQLERVNVTGYPFYQAYQDRVKEYPVYH